MAANTQNYFSNGQFITQARFNDIKHLHDMESIDQEKDKRAFVKNEKKSQDLIRKGVMQTANVFTIESYNGELMKHN